MPRSVGRGVLRRRSNATARAGAPFKAEGLRVRAARRVRDPPARARDEWRWCRLRQPHYRENARGASCTKLVSLRQRQGGICVCIGGGGGLVCVNALRGVGVCQCVMCGSGGLCAVTKSFLLFDIILFEAGTNSDLLDLTINTSRKNQV